MSSPTPDGPVPYGLPIPLAAAKRVAEAAEREAERNGWPMVIAIVDGAGRPVLLHKMDHTQNGSIAIAEGKARTAADFKRPTKDLEDTLAKGGLHLRLLAAPGMTPLDGGLPLLVDGRVVGAIGVSGMAPHQDAVVARAGADAL